MLSIFFSHLYSFYKIYSIESGSILWNTYGIIVKCAHTSNATRDYCSSNKQIRSITRNKLLLFSIIFLLAIPAFSEDIVTWDGEKGDGKWSSKENWSTNSVPFTKDDVILDCSCTVILTDVLVIDGTLTIASGTTLDMAGFKIIVGSSADISAKTATLINNGTIINASDIKVKGDLLPTGTDVGDGPFIINSGTITTEKFSVGNSNGGGKLTNSSTGIIHVTGTGIDDMHVDGTICNEGIINVTNQILFHGAVVTCGGIINASIINLEGNSIVGGGASGAGSDIQDQSFSDGAGCSGADSSSPIYFVIGGDDKGPNEDNTYTFEELLEEFGTTDTNPIPQFTLDPVLVSSCGEVFDNTPPTILNFPNDTTVYLPDDKCEIAVNWIPPTATDNLELQSISSSHNPGDIFPVGTNPVTYFALDNAGNSSEKSFNITVLDTISPVINNLPADIYQSANPWFCGVIVNWAPPTASDNCGTFLRSSHKSGDFFYIGTTTVTYTALDVHGNTTTQSFNVTVADEIPPVFFSCPTKFTVEPIDLEANTAIITWEEPVAKDACSEISIRSNYASGSVFDYGIITIIYTATDLSGNTEVCSFDVGSENNRSPVTDNLFRKVKAGESIDIYLNARDPDGDHVSIVSIFHNENNATISSVDADNLSFIYTSFTDFYGTDTVLVELFDNGLPSCSTTAEVVIEVERNSVIEVSSAITSNGDFVNDFLFIKNIDLFPENSVHIFDRWGGLLYQATRYNNESIAWRGTNDQGNFGNKKYAPTGTYFYVIDLGDGSDKITGAVEVIR